MNYMGKVKNIIKGCIPDRVWQMFRKIYFFSKPYLNAIGPYKMSFVYFRVKIFYGRGNDLIRRLKQEVVFEKDMCAAIVEELKDNPNFLDIGANIGLVSVYVATHVKNAVIHAFEPGIHQYRFLNETIKVNNLENIKIYNNALGDHNGVVKFFVHDAMYSALDGLKDTERRGKTRVVEVPMVTLDSWWVDAGKPSFSVVKIDTEGAELLVLRGGVNFIKEVRPVIFFEIESANLKAYPYTKSDIFEFFEKNKYLIEPVTTDTYKAVPVAAV